MVLRSQSKTKPVDITSNCIALAELVNGLERASSMTCSWDLLLQI